MWTFATIWHRKLVRLELKIVKKYVFTVIQKIRWYKLIILWRVLKIRYSAHFKDSINAFFLYAKFFRVSIWELRCSNILKLKPKPHSNCATTLLILLTLEFIWVTPIHPSCIHKKTLLISKITTIKRIRRDTLLYSI